MSRLFITLAVASLCAATVADAQPMVWAALDLRLRLWGISVVRVWDQVLAQAQPEVAPARR